MKRLRYIPLLLALILMGCNPQSEYVTEGVEILLMIPESTVSAASVKVDIIPENDKVYYYCGIIPDSAFDATIDMRFMEYVLDSVYLDYVQWRKTLLATSSPYVATFSSHCLSYGQDSRLFDGLSPETDYLVYAFCVNPETNQPMGELYGARVVTDAYHPADLTFTFSVEQKDDGCWLSIEPDNDSDPYGWDIAAKEDVEHYGGVKGYVEAYLTMFRESGQTDYMLTRGYAYFNMTTYLTTGTDYYVLAAGYDGNLTTPIHYKMLRFETGMDDMMHEEMAQIIDSEE